MAVTDKKRFAGIPSWIFTKLSSLWVLFSVSKPHDHGNDRPKPERQPPISDPSDIEAFGTPIACPSQQTSPVNQPQILNPIVQLFRDRDMGKTVLGFVMPMTTMPPIGIFERVSSETDAINFDVTLYWFSCIVEWNPAQGDISQICKCYRTVGSCCHTSSLFRELCLPPPIRRAATPPPPIRHAAAPPPPVRRTAAPPLPPPPGTF
ncbi:hypothetical protein F0562_033949 [Nyssa sinensis]|uniref:Uncharacterized protein n=1 Tax=Nyssa sinensis TaxID=561372 RepID=A0A5J5AHB6_9ASTE|nr:hypothetical protein F0562_033949 [Nyssa sinensis]